MQLQKIIPHKIKDDSRKVEKGDLFIALRGTVYDGHHFVSAAVAKGAEVLVVEDSSCVPSSFRGQVLVKTNTRLFLPVLLNRYYDFPSSKMFCVGITGTNGKTTSAYMLKHLFSQGGWKTEVIGTIDSHIEGLKHSSALTTPPATVLQKKLFDFYQHGVQAAVMEISSIGLDQYRAVGVDLNIALFTNFTQDHLDYHKNTENYLKAKKRLFDIGRASKNCRAVLNADDPQVLACSRSIKIPYVSFGSQGRDFRYKVLKESLESTEFEVFFQNRHHVFQLGTPGLYNVSNAMGALASAVLAGFSLEHLSLESFRGAAGRLQKIQTSHPASVFVDYAHSPHALENVLKTLTMFRKEKVITVFGCGGDRDASKRALMGSAAERYSDHIVITSDNPRNEDPKKIIQDILKGIPNQKKVFIEEDRKKGIQKGLELAGPKDIVLIAGKGHERFQIIGDQKIHFSDEDEVKKAALRIKTS